MWPIKSSSSSPWAGVIAVIGRLVGLSGWLAGVGGQLAQCCMPQLLRLAVFRPRADSLAMSCSRLAGLLTGRLGAPCVAGWVFFLLGIMGVVESQGEGKGASDL